MNDKSKIIYSENDVINIEDTLPENVQVRIDIIIPGDVLLDFKALAGDYGLDFKVLMQEVLVDYIRNDIEDGE